MADKWKLPDILQPASVPLRILFVTDDDGCYEDVDDEPPKGNFRSLHLVPEALQEIPGVSLTVRRAHRDTDTSHSVTADIQPFHFVTHGAELDAADELWLFGIAWPGGSPNVEGTEVTAIDSFMKSNRGVFATGDHATLGGALCGNIPRVKSMRFWDAPAAFNEDRHDTRIRPAGEDPGIFDDQADNQHEYDDDVPQRILLKLFGGTKLTLDGAPHEVLCSDEGAIDVLPDHMHEGWCVVPDPLPAEFGGIKPQIIASGINRALNAVRATFGLIGVYDGESKSLGRTVVDSTWHHFVHLNLKAFPTSQTDAGKRAWRLIRKYYRNLAIWLAPKAKRDLIAMNAFWFARWSPHLSEVLPVFELRDTASIHRFGLGSLKALGRAAGNQCFVVKFIIDKLKAKLASSPFQPHPIWEENAGRDQILPPTFFPAVAAAGILKTIWEAYPSVSRTAGRAQRLHDDLPELIDRGIDRALAVVVPEITRAAAHLASLKT